MAPVKIDLNQIAWEKLFRNEQYGSGYAGMPRVRGMKGAGIGTFLSALISALPIFFKSSAGKEAIKIGSGIVDNISKGESLGASVKHEGRAAVKRLTGLGKKRKANRRITHSSNTKRTKRSLLLSRL